MSLKAFHVFFVVVSTLFAAGFGVWAIRAFLLTGDVPILLLGIFSALAAVALPIYGVWFLKKTKNVGYV